MGPSGPGAGAFLLFGLPEAMDEIYRRDSTPYQIRQQRLLAKWGEPANLLERKCWSLSEPFQILKFFFFFFLITERGRLPVVIDAKRG